MSAPPSFAYPNGKGVRHAGADAGSVTVAAYQEVSEDGRTFVSGAGTSVTIRDAADHVLQVMTDLPPAIGTRLGVGSPGFPEGTPVAATPLNTDAHTDGLLQPRHP